MVLCGFDLDLYYGFCMSMNLNNLYQLLDRFKIHICSMVLEHLSAFARSAPPSFVHEYAREHMWDGISMGS